MNFLAPLFLLGALAVVGPVLFHLVRRETRDRVRFPSLMFLRQTPPRLTKRSRIEHWLLLLLRGMALGLLALAFARPFLRSLAEDKPSGVGGRKVVLLLDSSASLRRGGLWREAQKLAQEAVEAEAASDVAVLTFDRATSALVTFEEWTSTPVEGRPALASGRIQGAAPTWNGTHLATALLTAAEMLADSPDGKAASAEREIIVISDLQEGAKLDGLQGYDWPNGIQVRLAAVKMEKPGNAGLQVAAEGPGAAAVATPGVRLRVSNSPDATSESYQIGWAAEKGDSFSGSGTDVYVPPGQSRLITLPWPGQPPKPVMGRILLRGDAEGFDNAVHVVPPPVIKAAVVHAGSSLPAGENRGPLYFLRRALPQSQTLSIEVTDAGLEAPDAGKLNDAVLCVVTDALPDVSAAAIAARIKAGGTLLLMLRSEAANVAATASRLLGAAVSLTEVTPSSGYSMLGSIDFRHPLFAPFADPRFSDFTKIRFWKYRQFQLPADSAPAARVLARFDSGDPALLEVPLGQGRAFVLTAGWHPEDSQLALSSKFPSLLASLLSTTGLLNVPPVQHFVGSTVAKSVLSPPGAENVRVVGPDKSEVSLPAASMAFDLRTEPGIYSVNWAGGSGYFAANLDPAESRTAEVAAEQFEKLGVPLKGGKTRTAAAAVDAASLAGAAEAETRQKLWRWCIVAALVVLFSETLLAGWTARRSAATQEATP